MKSLELLALINAKKENQFSLGFSHQREGHQKTRRQEKQLLDL